MHKELSNQSQEKASQEKGAYESVINRLVEL